MNRQQFLEVGKAPYLLVLLAIIIVAAPPAVAQESEGTASLCMVGVTFTRISSGPIWDDSDCTHGVNWIDYNNDGYLDLYFPHWFYDKLHANALYTNNGGGGFTKVISGAVVTDRHSIDASWADYDNDGDVDGFACSPPTTSGLRQNYMYVNNGDGSFTKLVTGSVATDMGMSVSATWGDFDNDGDVDLLVGNHCPPPCTGGLGPFYYRNDGDSLARVDRTLLGLPNGDFAYHSVCDFDYDGDLDIVYRRNEQTNVCYRNDGDGTFTVDNDLAFVADNSIGFSWADYDNDGDFDLLETGEPECRLYNSSNGVFSRVPTSAFDPGEGTWLSGAWGDCDNDGDLDLVITSFTAYFVPQPNAFLENNGNGTFSKVTMGPVAADLEPSLGAAWGDFDRDGDLDLVIVNENYYHNALYQNGGNSNAWLDVACSGSRSNRSGIGAKVRVVATIDGQVVRQLREISSQSNLFSQAPLEAHFGLGDATVIDSLIMEWPSGLIDNWVNVLPRQLLTVTEGSSDIDGDGVNALDDNCPSVQNPLQEDANSDGVGDACCCVGATGNINSVGIVDLADLSALVSYLTGGGYVPPCPREANINNAGIVDLADLSALVSYLTGGGFSLPSCPSAPVTVRDIDGNTYQTVTVGTQVWMAENLKVTRYRNGDAIPNVTDGATWEGLSTGAYCDYDNDADNVATYGRLYNWYAVSDSRRIAPVGWHVATDADWKQLETYLGMSQFQADQMGWRGTNEGGKLKESGTTHWISPNTGATNESGFRALPAGYRYTGGLYYDMGIHFTVWSSTEINSGLAWTRNLGNTYSGVHRFDGGKMDGFSVRCVRDVGP